MADVKKYEEGTAFPGKRKDDLPNPLSVSLEEKQHEADSNKKQKVEVTAEENGTATLAADEMNPERKELEANSAAAEEENEEDDEEDYKAEEEDDDEDEHSNGQVEFVDKKGKGVAIDEKGKGKVLEDSEDDDSNGEEEEDDGSSDDSDTDFSDGLDDDGDFEDDPLAEVDLDNILPSRTRRSGARPGVRISSNSNKANDA